MSIRVRATDVGWDGFGLKLRSKGEEFDLPKAGQFAPEWMERLDSESSESSEIPETVPDVIDATDVAPKRKPGRPPKNVT